MRLFRALHGDGHFLTRRETRSTTSLEAGIRDFLDDSLGGFLDGLFQSRISAPGLVIL